MRAHVSVRVEHGGAGKWIRSPSWCTAATLVDASAFVRADHREFWDASGVCRNPVITPLTNPDYKGCKVTF